MTENDDGQTDVDFLINVLFDHNMSWIQQFLRDKGLSAKGNKPELRQRVESYVEDGTLSTGDLVDLLDAVEGWGNQHVYLYKASDVLIASLSNDKKLKETLRKLGLVRLFNRRVPLVLPCLFSDPPLPNRPGICKILGS